MSERDTTERIVHISEFPGKTTLHPRRRRHLHIAMFFFFEICRTQTETLEEGNEHGRHLNSLIIPSPHPSPHLSPSHSPSPHPPPHYPHPSPHPSPSHSPSPHPPPSTTPSRPPHLFFGWAWEG